MKKRFTKIMAALALLVSLAIPMGMRAAEGDVHDMGITQSTLLNNNTAIPSINIAAQSYSVNKVTINWKYNKTIENPVTIEVLVGENSWGTQTITGNTTADAVFEGESTIGAIVINFTNNTGAGTGHGTFYVNSVKLTEGESSGPAPTTYTVTFDAGDGTFVGNTDFPNASNSVTSGTYTLPSATPATGYTFNGWAMGETTYQAGASYTVSGNADFVASYTENATPTPGGPDVLNWAATGSPTNYTDWTYTAPSGAVYKGQSSGSTTGQYIQLRSNNNNSGIVTTTSAGKVTNISVTWNSSTTSGRTLNVYGKNSAYSAATDLYGNNAGTLIGTIVYGTSTELIITDDYEYIGMRSASGAMYLDEIQITWESVTPALVATPTFNPASGAEFGNDGLQVTITCETTGARIYYTLDGSTPDDGSNYYQSAITLTETTTIKAIAYDSDDNISSVATATYTYIDPNGPGTENNPYTVAQARAAIDAGTGTQGVYATGIVSSIPDAWSTQFNNITFNFVDTAGDSDFLQAYRCGSGTGVDASTVAVGDIVVVYGNLTKYGTTYEFGSGCQLVSLTHPVITEPTITVTPATLTVDAQEHLVNYLDLAYENIEVESASSFTVHYYNAEGEEIQVVPGEAWMIAGVAKPNNVYQVLCTIIANEGEARTAYFKVSCGETYSNLVTVNQEAYVAPTYAELPFEFNGGSSDIEGTDGLYQEGLDDYNASTNPTTKLKFDGTGDWLLLQFNERPGTLTFDIKNNSFSGGTFKVQTSENGVTFTDLKTYTEISGTQNEKFTNLGENVRYIKWIYTEKVSGNVGLGNIALAEYTEPQQYTLTVESFENLELITFTNDEMVMEGDGEITVTEGDEIMLSIVALEGYEMETLMVNGVNHVNDIADDFTYTFEMPAENVTISATAVEYVAPVSVTYSYTLANSIKSGKQYIIVGWADGTPYAMGYDKGNNRHAVEISVTGDNDENASVTIANTVTNPHEFTITSLATPGYYSIQDATASGYLYAASGSNNHLKTEAELDANHNGEWKITFDAESGSASVVASQSQNRNVMQFNNSSTLFACYATASQHPVFLYEKVEYTLNITGYGTSAGGYVLIASPVTVDPSTIAGTNGGMTANDYDLYYFDESQQKEWINYRNQPFDLEPGKGYLYAHKTDDTFTWTGTPYTGDGEVTLSRQGSGSFAGCNLVGNPYNKTAYIADGREFYTMNDAGSALVVATSESIEALEGVFVIANTDGETMQFTTHPPLAPQKGSVILNISKAPQAPQKGSVVIDRAIVRFDSNSQLPKFQLFENTSKLYIPQGTQDFAVVNAEAQGELPVNFKAESNGSYTFSVNAENVEFSYLHLIDNMTGADIDLLVNPSYSFEANTSDYESRFKLVFAQGDNSSNDNFAFVSNGEIIVNGEGVLQMFDVTGRLVYTAEVNSAFRIPNSEFTSGVYVLQLNDKTQKIVLK